MRWKMGLWGLLLLVLIPVIQAQPILPDESITVTLPGGPVDLVYAGAGAEIVSIEARSLDAKQPVDVTLAIYHKNERIAFNDDADPQTTDAALRQVALDQPGSYTVRIHSFNGVQTGPVQVTLTAAPLIPDCADLPAEVTLARANVMRCDWTLQAGQVIEITAQDTSGTLDPVLRLLAPDGQILARNDDHGTADWTLNVLDARLSELAIPAAGTYRIVVSDFSGQPGTLALTTQIMP